MKNSIQFKRCLNHFLDLPVYMVVLLIVIIYPLLITVLSAFKSGMPVPFTLDFSGNLSFDNFSNFSLKPLGTWHMNTLVIAIIYHDCSKQASCHLRRLRLQSLATCLARKQSLVFFT